MVAALEAGDQRFVLTMWDQIGLGLVPGVGR
jgi:hypothetical protein